MPLTPEQAESLWGDLPYYIILSIGVVVLGLAFAKYTEYTDDDHEDWAYDPTIDEENPDEYVGLDSNAVSSEHK